MKILFLSSTIYEKALPQFTKNKNGLSLMIGDIVKNIAKTEECYLLTYVITPAVEYNNIHVVRHLWRDVLKKLKFINLCQGVKNALRFSMPLKKRLKYVYYTINKGYVEDAIKRINPDIVNIHGLNYATKSFMETCEKMKVNYVLSIHGLIGLDESVKASVQDKLLEKDILSKSEKSKLTVTVISSGIKHRIVDRYDLNKGENIHVILNGTNTEEKKRSQVNLFEKYNIPKNNVIMLCIGNITKNKNQMQVVRSYHLLEESIKNNITVLFLGHEVDGGEVRNKIEQLGYNKNLILCGFVDRNEMADYFLTARVNLFPSLNDGFGLPIIEGFVYGIPTVTFDDIDAIQDIYSPDAMLLVKKREDKSFAMTMVEAMEKSWDENIIKTHGKKFSIEATAEGYKHIFLKKME